MLPSVYDPLSGLLDQLQGEVVGRGQGIEIITRAPTSDLAHLIGWAAARGIEFEGLTVESPDLEEAYLRLVGEAPAVDESGAGGEWC